MARILALIDDGEALLRGTTPASMRLLAQIERVASTPKTTVLMLGDRGRETSLVARCIHARSQGARSEAGGEPFVAVDCSRPHVALAGPEGSLAAARGGTLFLDEVAELDLTRQAEALEQLELHAAGAPDEGAWPRVVASTSIDLESRVESQRFRADLFYRLNVLTIRVPALIDRIGDVDDIARTVLRRCERVRGGELALSDDALEALRAHDWPGSLLELELALGRAALLSEDGIIRSEHLQLDAGASRSDDWLPTPTGTRSLRELEERTIRRVLHEEEGNRSSAARVLGINRTTLYNKLRQYGIE